MRCFAISETKKFGHVTFFWNGNRSGYINESLETYVEIPVTMCRSTRHLPMKAAEITDATFELLRNGQFDWGRINYANGDLVRHTGDLDATIESMEMLDDALARLVGVVVDELDAMVIFTADHGNADIMYTEKNGIRSPKTSHTLSARAVRSPLPKPRAIPVGRRPHYWTGQHRCHRHKRSGLRTANPLPAKLGDISLKATSGNCKSVAAPLEARLRMPAK